MGVLGSSGLSGLGTAGDQYVEACDDTGIEEARS
jgi:hypothetical protein